MPKRPFKTVLTAFTLAALSACSLVKYQPVATINKIDMNQGYRFETSQFRREEDDTFIILMLSGGGTRAAALGYGVLEQLQQQKVTIGGKSKSLMSNVDLVVGVSGGSVLAAYFALKGEETIPMFYKLFLHQNFQRQVVKQAFSMTNLPRLASPEYGRGDLLQEQFENHLFGKATFRDLEKYGKGPFAIISATDMGAGERLNFTQEYFDPMCIDLGGLRLARAVAASSSVPMVFAPITLNNNGGNCGYALPPQLQMTGLESQKQQNATYQEFKNRFNKYSDSKTRPYIHLIDGGLTDNLGMRSLLDMTEMYPDKVLSAAATCDTSSSSASTPKTKSAAIWTKPPPYPDSATSLPPSSTSPSTNTPKNPCAASAPLSINVTKPTNKAATESASPSSASTSKTCRRPRCATKC